MRLGTFSWRSVFGWLLVIFGGLLVVMNVLGIPLHFIVRVVVPRHPLFHVAWWRMLVGGGLEIACGTLWFLAGRRILAQQTWWPIAMIAIGYVCGVLGAMTIAPGGI